MSDPFRGDGVFVDRALVVEAIKLLTEVGSMPVRRWPDVYKTREALALAIGEAPPPRPESTPRPPRTAKPGDGVPTKG